MSSREEREVIRLNFAELTKNLNPMEIIDDMQVHKLLTLNEHSDVETKTKQSRRDGVSHLLKALQRRKPGSLRVFIELLKKVDGSEFLAEKLEADLNRVSKPSADAPMETDPPLPTPQQHEDPISMAEQETVGEHEPVPPSEGQEQPPQFVLPQLPVNVADPSNPNWSLPEFTDDAYKPSEATDDGLESYCMKSQPRGVAVIINNKNFTGKMKRREGTDLDADNLFRLFKGLCYDVKVFKDLTGAQMLSTLKHVAKLDHRNMDSLVVCILSHGLEGQLYGTDEELIPVDEVFKPFNGYNCPTLVGKPKVFLMQACRGGVFDYGVEATDSPFDQAQEEEASKEQEPSLEEMKKAAEEMYRQQQKEFEATDGQAVVLPAEADFAVVFATVPGYVSWRNSAFGSWFIKAFVEVMAENVYRRHFLEILTLVNNKVALQFQSRDGNKQITDSSIRLRKFLYFNPPNPPRKF